MSRRSGVKSLALCAVALAAVATFSIPSPAAAECPYIPPYPAVTGAVRSAREIVVGTVLENVGGQVYDFRMRIDNVLRGSATIGEVRRVAFLYPKWPLDTTAVGGTIAPCEAISAAPGNVIALAYDALAPDGKTRYNAVSWISGRPEFREDFATATLAEIQALADLPQTDSGPKPVTNGRTELRSQVIDPVVVLVVGLLAGFVALRLVTWRAAATSIRISKVTRADSEHT
jgi:hypothetical protein